MVFSKRSVNSLVAGYKGLFLYCSNKVFVVVFVVVVVAFIRFENYYVQQLKEEGKLLTKI